METSVTTIQGENNIFPIIIGLHQRSTLSPYLFAFLIDKRNFIK